MASPETIEALSKAFDSGIQITPRTRRHTTAPHSRMSILVPTPHRFTLNDVQIGENENELIDLPRDLAEYVLRACIETAKCFADRSLEMETMRFYNIVNSKFRMKRQDLFHEKKRLNEIIYDNNYDLINENENDIINKNILSTLNDKEKEKLFNQLLKKFEKDKEDDYKRKMIGELEILLRTNPQLVSIRSAYLRELAIDGFTPLHAAARVDNDYIIDFLIQKNGVDIFARDLQGRTALHVAAEEGNINSAKLLKRAMFMKTSIHPVGQNAPLDLVGRTPLGWRSKRKRADELEKILFEEGDASIQPFSPTEERCKRHPNAMLMGYASNAGWRVEMEDSMCIYSPIPLNILNNNNNNNQYLHLFGLFDGHGGPDSAIYLSENLLKVLKSLNERNILLDKLNNNNEEENENEIYNIFQSLLKETFLILDNNIKDTVKDKSGSTAIVFLCTNNYLIFASVGDSRMVLIKEKVNSNSLPEFLQANIEHKPDLQEEKERIYNAGGDVLEIKVPKLNNKKKMRKNKNNNNKKDDDDNNNNNDIDDDMEILYRVCIKGKERECLSMSRAFGDFFLKNNNDLNQEEQIISCAPYINIIKRNKEIDRFLIMACDGIWDVITNGEIRQMVYARFWSWSPDSDEMLFNIPEVSELVKICDDIIKECLKRNGRDNMSIMIIYLGHEINIGKSNSNNIINIDQDDDEMKIEDDKIRRQLF